MRITLALTILSAMVATGATRTPVVTAPLFAFQDVTTATPNPGGSDMGPSEIDLVKFGFTQGGLALVLIVVILGYRRDIFRKLEASQAQIDALRDEKREHAAILDRCANAMLTQAVATQANTKATELLAQNVNNLAERRGWQRE